MRAEDETMAILGDAAVPATDADWGREYGDYIIAAHVVGSIDEAIEYVYQYSTGHSECIVTDDEAAAEKYLNSVDAAAVYHNASTRFTDGGEFGLGAEIGISTQKLHARGPLGLNELTSMGTFSKSLASLGGYMATDARVADYVRHTSRPFIFSASITPASCAVALTALKKLEVHPEIVDRLRVLSVYAREGYKARNVRIRESETDVATPIIPLYTYEVESTLEAAKKIYEAGVYVNPVLPPAAAPSECLLRTSYMKLLTGKIAEPPEFRKDKAAMAMRF